MAYEAIYVTSEQKQLMTGKISDGDDFVKECACGMCGACSCGFCIDSTQEIDD